MTIRTARPSDIPAVIDLGRQVVEESPRYGKLTFSQERFAMTLHTLIDSDQGLVLVAEVDGQIVGAMLGFVSAHWISSDLTASDLGLFVTAAHRGSSIGADLINAYAAWARGTGAVLINAGITTGIKTEATAALYERLGFKRCGILLEI